LDPQDMQVVDEAGVGRFSGEWKTGYEGPGVVVSGGIHDPGTETVIATKALALGIDIGRLDR